MYLGFWVGCQRDSKSAKHDDTLDFCLGSPKESRKTPFFEFNLERNQKSPTKLTHLQKKNYELEFQNLAIFSTPPTVTFFSFFQLFHFFARITLQKRIDGILGLKISTAKIEHSIVFGDF